MAGSDYEDEKESIGDTGSAGLPPKKRRGQPPDPSRTIAGLGLDMEAARAGRTHFLLPPEHRGIDGGKAYPLPSGLDDLLAVSLLHVPNGSQSGPSAYIRRARKEYAKRIKARNPAKLDEAANRAESVLQGIRETRKEAQAELAGIKEDVVRAAATLTDLYGLIRKGSEMILAGFVNNQPVNGKPVEIDQFNQTQGKILGHIAKLGGVSEDDKAEAESAVFEQAAQATRKRLEDNEALARRDEPEKVTH